LPEAVYLDASQQCQPHDFTANASLCRDLPVTNQSEFCVVLTFQTDRARKISYGFVAGFSGFSTDGETFAYPMSHHVTKITCRAPLKALSRCHLSRILVLPTCRSVKSRWLSSRRGKAVPYRVKYELEPSCLRFEFTSQAELEFLFGVVNVILRQPLLRGTEVVTPRSCYLRTRLQAPVESLTASLELFTLSRESVKVSEGQKFFKPRLAVNSSSTIL
jgi:hypothetical protein